MGERLTPLQIHQEWVEYKQTFDDILTRWSASLARSAKAEKKRIESLMQQAEPTHVQAPAGPLSRKAALRSRVAAMRGYAGGRGLQVVNGDDLPTTEGDDDE